MYGFPANLDLSSALGQETTQFCVGPYDLQFSLGPVTIAIGSRIELVRSGEVLEAWEAGQWPGPGFYDVFNTPVIAVSRVTEKRLCFLFEGGLEMHLLDTSDRYESMQIYLGSTSYPYII